MINPKIPVFIPYGYRGIGKTMLIMQLMRYLRQEGYIVRPNLIFKEESDHDYYNLCQRYMNQLHNVLALAATGVKDTILIDVMDHKGSPVCYMIDQAGEHQYDINNPHSAISQEMYNIVKLPNRKIWGFMVENNNWLDLQQRKGYVQNIKNMSFISHTPKDKVIFIYNKVDLTPFVVNYSKINYKGLFDSADSVFPDIFAPFEELNIFKKILRGKYTITLLPFQTGDFTCCSDLYGNTYTSFAIGPFEYPKRLWNEILKCIR